MNKYFISTYFVPISVFLSKFSLKASKNNTFTSKVADQHETSNFIMPHRHPGKLYRGFQQGNKVFSYIFVLVVKKKIKKFYVYITIFLLNRS